MTLLSIEKPNPTNDNDVFRNMASNYSLNHLTMPNAYCGSDSFDGGITNGGDLTCISN